MLNISRNVKETTNPPIVVLTDIAQRLRQEGRDVIVMGQAVPDLPPEPSLLAAARDSLTSEYINFYSTDRGLIELRNAIARKLELKNAVKADPEQEILVTAGANQAILAAFLTILDHDDEVIIPTPYYFNHEMAVRIAGGRPVECEMTEGVNGYSLDIDKIRRRITPQTKAITLVTPNNPTGAAFSREALEDISQIAFGNNLYVIADETYDQFLFGERKHFSIGSIDRVRENVITVSSFSKRYSMTGWRLGYLAANAALIEEMLKVHDTMVICAPVITQTAGIKAIQEDLAGTTYNTRMDRYILELERRKNVMREMVDRSDYLEWREPHGTLFAFVKYVDRLGTSEELAFDILNKANVVVIPGSSFGKCGEHHFRISYGAVDSENIREAFTRMEKYFNQQL